MENAQSKVESKNDAAEEVRNTDQIDAQSMKKEENSENASAELLEKIKDQVEVIYFISVFFCCNFNFEINFQSQSSGAQYSVLKK